MDIEDLIFERHIEEAGLRKVVLSGDISEPLLTIIQSRIKLLESEKESLISSIK
jgi:hypothetical protein